MSDISVYKETHSNWCGSYRVNKHTELVEVMFARTGPDPKNFKGEFRVCAWGNDDFGLEKDYASNEAGALNEFYQIIGLKSVEIEDLVKMGFKSA